MTPITTGSPGSAGPSPDRRSIVAEALRKIDDLTARLEVAEKGDTEPIAVVGMGCRLPGGISGTEGYWQALLDGVDGVVRVPPARWDADAFFSSDRTRPGTICSPEGGFLTSWEPDEFDAAFFGLSPREADAMDPQQRLLLEVAWEALENAGITAQAIRGSQTGVFVGLTTYDYSLIAAQLPPQAVDPYLPFGNGKNFAAGRLSYFLGLHGPAVSLDTACSSSLVTIHLACQSLRRRETDRALAAGVNLMLSPENSIATSAWGMLAPDGRCKTFDAAADGYVRSEGAGVVVLKRLSDAVRDGDRVLAVVRGSAVNQDGPSSGQTVPSGPAQQAVLRSALVAARLEPGDIDYIEAHGTGTALGDPIELDALSAVFADRGTSAPLVLGSVKTNLGHLESAAGVAGFIKTVLSIQHGYIPRHLHFSELTPNASAAASRFTIAAGGMDWPAVDRARRAGVSSFGVSGTNAHVVVEQAPATEPAAREPEPPINTLVVTGKSPARIAATAAMLADWLAGPGAQVPLADVAHTLNHHRTRHKQFATVCVRDRAQAIAGLRALAAGDSAPGVVAPHEGLCGSGTVFVYSGQGSHWAGMGRRLLAEEPAFAAAVDELEPVFTAQVGFSLRQVIADGASIAGDAQVQPVMMGLQLALTELWRSYGVTPDAVIGHSMGEVTAAVVAGALTVAEGLKVIAIRSTLMGRLAGQGAVALLELDAAATEELLVEHPQVSIAGYVSPRQTVVAGPVAPVESVLAAVSAQERFARRVNMEVASHTALMDPILGELRTELSGLTPKTPAIPFLSTVRENPTDPGLSLDADYWVANVRQPARLTQAVAAAATDHVVFVEVSAHPILTHAIDETLEAVHHHSIGTLWRDGDDTLGFRTNLNSVHTITPPVTPHPAEPHPVLPSTPWQHTRHWIAIENAVQAAESAPRPGTVLGTHIAVAGSPPAHLWQARLAPGAVPYRGSHRHRDIELIPASVLLQTLSIAAADSGMLADVRFFHPIVVDRPRVVQVVADGDYVTVSSRPADSTSWVRHVSARIADQINQADTAPVAGDDEAAEFTDESVTALWREWGSEGRPFGWAIGSCRSADGVLRADVELTDTDAETSAPALLDAAAHIARLLDSANPQLMVPTGLAAMVTATGEFPEGRGVIEVRRRGGGAEELIVDIAVKAPDGTTCIDIRALRYAAIGFQATAADEDPRSIAQVIDWQPWHDHTGQPAQSPCTVAVVGQGEDARMLADRLAAAGHRPADPAVAECVLYVADPGTQSETDLDCAARLTSEVAELVRRLVQREDHPPRLWLITRGVREAASPDAVRQSGLWGLAGVIRAEQPELCGGLVDLPASADRAADIADSVAALSGVLRTPAKSILALRDGEFSAPALAPLSGDPVRETLRCRPDGSYLITGGLGALGLLMAGWLADRGARRLVLAGRTGLPARRDWDNPGLDTGTRDKIVAVRALESRGVTVDAVAIDIGSRDAVRALLAQRDEAGAPPVRGVIHAAGITEAQLVTELDDERLRATLWPKVAGAQVLHHEFPPGSVDFFYLTAAAGAVFGVPGQAAYAAANAYLDGLGRARHAQGCHTVSLDWVAWQGLGFGADAQVAVAELERMGSRPILPEEAFLAWEHLDRYDVGQAVMAPPPAAAGAPDADSQPAARDWSQLAADAILSELEVGLRGILARELRMPEADLELDRPFAELGLNSVMAMTVRRETEHFVGIELSATMLWNHPTITALAAHLAKKVSPQDDSRDGIDAVPDDGDSVLDDLFDSVESAPAGLDGISWD